MNLNYTDRAKEDVEISFEWYEKQRKGLGFEFLDCLEVGIKKIINNPEAYGICYSSFRRFLIRRFPFSVYYTIEQDGIVVHSVFDNRQHPRKRP
ncbi:MAG: type II toxin-antitoxin system RelE/ParE family toxin [Campylobacterales bacterium]